MLTDAVKVLHVIDSLGRGGAEQVLVTLLPELNRQGVATVVVVRGGAMDLAPVLSAAGVRVRQLARRHRWNLPLAAREIAGIARAEAADIVHAHLYFPAVTVALMRWWRMSPARTCVTFHNLAYAGANASTPGLWVRRRLARWLYPRGFDRMFGVSQAVVAHYQQALGLKQLMVLHNAVPVLALQQAGQVAKVQQPPGTDLTVVLPGRIVPEKGHADLVAALRILDAKIPRLRAVVAGDGPLRRDVEAMVSQAGLADQVEFTGALDHAAMIRTVATADIVVVPSRHEGFGLTALEAMALGRAVVATTVGGLPEVMGDTGVLVPPVDPEALAAAIDRLAQDPGLRKAMGDRAAARARAEFDIGAVTGRLKAAYQALLSPDRPPD